MSYSGKQHFSGDYVIRDIWTYLIRFIIDSGYWSIVDSGISNSGVGTYSISQDITASSLDTWLDLQSADAYDEVLKKDITDESFNSGTLDNPVSLANSNIDDSSEVVTSTDGNTTYVKDTDYSMDYTNGTITCLSTGSMVANTDYKISYTYTLSNTDDYEINNNLGRVKFLSTGSVTSGDTIHATYTWKREYIILYSTGVSGSEKIYIGAIPYINSDGVHGYINWKAYKFWQEGMSFGDTSLGTKYNGFGFALWSSDTDLWLFVNQQRVIAVSCIQTYYNSIYIGFFNRFLMPHEYNYPLCVISSDDTGMNYDSQSGYRHFIPNAKRINMMNERNLWTAYYQETTYTDEYYISGRNFNGILPNQQDTGNLVQVHYPSNASIGLLPIYLYWNGNIYGQLDDVYFTPASILSSESEITIGNDTYIVFEDVFRHGWSQFMAIKEA